MNRAAIYVRVSTDYAAQKDSPEHQFIACQEYALSIGLSTSSDLIYSDTGLSGMEMENRPEVNRMLGDARQGHFEAVLFTAISRFSRDMADAFNMKKKLEAIYGIRIISIEEGYDSAIEGRNNEMIFTVHAMLAAHKSKEMSVAIKRGLRQSAKKGRHIGNIPPYGYKKTADKRLYPDPVEARIVREVFTSYLSGMSARTIAHNLNERGIQTSSKHRLGKSVLWQPSTITAILHNEVYLGKIVAHKWTTARHVADSRRRDMVISRPIVRPKTDWVIVKRAHDPLIEQKVFDQVHDLLRKKATNHSIRQNTNLLAGMMYCNECGGKMIVTGSKRSSGSNVHTYRYIVCAKTRRIGKFACNNHFITKYDAFLFALVQHLQLLMDSWLHSHDAPAHHETLVSKYSEYRDHKDPLDNPTLAKLYQALDRNRNEQIENLRAYRQGLFSKEVISKDQQELIEQEKQLQSEITHLEEGIASCLALQEKLQKVPSILNFFQHMALYENIVQRLAIQMIVDHIVFYSDGRISVLYTWKTPNQPGS